MSRISACSVRHSFTSSRFLPPWRSISFDRCASCRTSLARSSGFRSWWPRSYSSSYRYAGSKQHKPTTAIVRSGPYQWSRNPIYLAFSILQLGIACWLNNLWVLVTLGAAWGLMTWVVIPREEHYLERKFGADYLQYKAKVRRWL